MTVRGRAETESERRVWGAAFAHELSRQQEHAMEAALVVDVEAALASADAAVLSLRSVGTREEEVGEPSRTTLLAVAELLAANLRGLQDEDLSCPERRARAWSEIEALTISLARITGIALATPE